MSSGPLAHFECVCLHRVRVYRCCLLKPKSRKTPKIDEEGNRHGGRNTNREN